jgi:hypothetical protein
MDDNQPLFHTPKVLKVSQNLVWPIRFVLFCVSFYFLYKTYSAYNDGYFYGSRQYHNLEDGPIFSGLCF